MIEIACLLEDVMGQASDRLASAAPDDGFVDHGCDVCGEIKPDVDLWAVHPETLEQIWLCAACDDL